MQFYTRDFFPPDRRMKIEKSNQKTTKIAKLSYGTAMADQIMAPSNMAHYDMSKLKNHASVTDKVKTSGKFACFWNQALLHHNQL